MFSPAVLSQGSMRGACQSSSRFVAAGPMAAACQPKAVQVRHFAYNGLKPDFETFDHPSLEKSEFIKNIRKPVGLYTETLDQIKREVAELGSLDSHKEQAGLDSVLSKGEKDAYLHALLSNVLFSKAVHTHFDKSCFGLPLFGAACYSHMWAGLGNHIMAKRNCDIKQALKIITYYRTPIISEELFRLGYTPEQVHELIAKQFYLQYWSGNALDPSKKDPLVFNPMVRTFYPTDSHIGAGSTDLGRDTELQAAKLYCMGVEGMDAPVTVINTGDTGFFTDGAMHALQHFVEAAERGYKMPVIFSINSNNAAISARLDYGQSYGDLGDAAVERIQKRFEMWDKLIDPGYTTWAHDMKGGIESMKKAADQVMETGRPTYVISRWPFRPGGHASDQNPAAEDQLLDQFTKYKDLLVHQLCAAAPEGFTGADLVGRMEKAEEAIMGQTSVAIRGCKVLTRDECKELSQPGSTTVLKKESGQAIDLDVNYLLGKGQRKFAGMGSEIFSTMINEQMKIADEEGRACRYVHQENHHKGKHDTRGGVYGELQAIGPEHADKFVGFMPQEAQVVQVGAAYRSVLPPGNRVFVKGPHTIFNEHARDHIKYAAYRYCDSGEHANHIYLFDGGSLAFREKEKVIDPETGDEVERDLFLARVGEHHNTPDYSSFGGEANTIMCLPIDMNILSACMPEMVRLHDMGRMVIGVGPTMAFGQLHPQLPLPDEKKHVGVNDFFRVKIPGTKQPLSRKKLVVIGWGPDCRMIAKVLAQENLDCELMVINWNRPPNSLIEYLDNLARKGTDTEVMCVDPNPNSALLGPIIAQIRYQIGYASDLFFSECTVGNAYVPYGLGDTLIQEKDIYRTLKARGIIEGVPDLSQIKRKQSQRATSGAAPTPAPAASAASPSGAVETVLAPMDGEGVYVTFIKNVGDTVKADDVIAEVESDKATIEIQAPCDGVIQEFLVKEKTEMNVEGDKTEIAKIAAGGDAPAASASSSASGPIEMVKAPMDGEGVYVKYVKQVGESVKADELICEIESDKATIEITSPVAGVIKEYLVPQGKEINVEGDATEVVSVQTAGAPAAASEAAPSVSKKKAVTSEPERKKLSRYQVAMAKGMSVGDRDTNCFNLLDRVDFKSKVVQKAKDSGVSPVAVLIKALGTAASNAEMNIKLSKDRTEMKLFPKVNIGCAIDVNGQLRTAVVKDVTSKSYADVMADVKRMAAAGAKLPAEDQNLDEVCFTVSSMGKDATDVVIPVLPKGTTGIMGVGKLDEQGKAFLAMTLCHATMSGVEGSNLMKALHTELDK